MSFLKKVKEVKAKASPKLDDHDYGEFIKAVMADGHSVQWTDTKADIKLKSGYNVNVSFSYNEPKMYLEIVDKRQTRILSDKKEVADVITNMDKILMQLKKYLESVEG